MDDELDRLKPAGLPADKQRWNIGDLQAYVAAMQAEITHVESMIAEKNKVQSAANANTAACPLIIRPLVVGPSQSAGASRIL